MSGEETERRVIAVVALSYDAYQRGIIATVRRRAAAAGYGVLCPVGRERALLDAAAGAAITPPAGRLDVRGVLMLSGVIGRDLSLGALGRLAGRLVADTGRPLISLGVAVPGVPSVALECEAALTTLMAHMTREPARRRFVFMRGYADGPDSRERERVFRRELARRGIEVDERLVLEGQFTGADAYSALDALLAEGHRVDAVVAANDVMATSAVMALERHGLSVPHDVVVSGFDDVPRTIESQPLLTTVRQHIDRQALAATDLLLGAIERDATLRPDTLLTVPAELVIRHSSCPDTAPEPAPSDDPLAAAFRSTDPALALRTVLAERLREVPPPESVDVETLAAEVAAPLLGDGERLAEGLQRALERAPIEETGGGDGRWWQHLIGQLEDLRERAGSARRSAFEHALSRLDGALRAARERDRFERDTQRQRHERLLLSLAACPTCESIWPLLREGLVAVGVRRAWVTLADDERETCRLAFALDDPSVEGTAERFAASAVLPPRLGDELENALIVLSPLTVGGERRVGQLLLDPGNLRTLELDALTASLAQALTRARHAAELHDSHRALARIARLDALTGLPNRALFGETLDASLSAAARDGEEVALLFLDLDGFKLINDTLGHSAGDQLLRIVAERMARVLRAGDTLARLGGDEFTIIAPQRAGTDAATRIAGDVLAAIGRPCSLGERLVDVSASVGIARYPIDAENAEALLSCADAAMYHAKARGKNRLAFYAPELGDEAMSRLELLEDMRRDIETDAFRMLYQPRVALADGSLIGFEALMRWRRSRDGAEIPPTRFIPIAEESGLIERLDGFALDAACRQARRWQSEGTPMPVAVNLSVRCLQETDVLERVSGTLRRHGLDPTLLELEITESAAMSDVERNIEKIAALRALGVSVAIDDFGTGYSSLSYLRRLPVTSLKVDRAFLSGVDADGATDPADVAIVSAVVALGASLGYRIVAEGIESEAQREFAQLLDCDEGQGWLFGRPLDAVAATARLHEACPATAVPA